MTTSLREVVKELFSPDRKARREKERLEKVVADLKKKRDHLRALDHIRAETEKLNAEILALIASPNVTPKREDTPAVRSEGVSQGGAEAAKAGEPKNPKVRKGRETGKS